MKKSVIIATYNGEKYIEKQLLSILYQSVKVDEVVIMDDKSTDNTVFIIKNFIKKYKLDWTLNQNIENLGYRKNFYEGLKRVSGDIVLLCDQDDIWKTDKVEDLVNIFEMKKNALLIASSFNFINDEDEYFTVETDTKKSNNNLLDMRVEKEELVNISLNIVIKKNFAQGCCMAMRKELIEDYIAISNNDLPHDWELALLAAGQGECFYYNKALINYRIHDSNAIGLNNVIMNTRQQSTKHRVENRIEVLSEELKSPKFLLSFNKLLLDNVTYINKMYTCYKYRINCIQLKKPFRLLIKCILGEYRNLFSSRAIFGDIVSLFAKK